ncbi:pentapeptide repeat-containing protein [Streptomyces mirabilis]|uniref:pentapeptide repeat-containing protein n=1 Tax=Streptomyces mirabilis TaxID=68239 RepID=UPI0022595CAC|nr:pentapeptide repeat-containing protein [Streptomyces mirabilis]MCX4617950.1 pentapeptide repeat-containing protein [Streptomyces mirabilis]
MASLPRRRQAPRGQYAPNLWPVVPVALLALGLAGLVGWWIYHYAYDHFAQAAADQKPPKPVNINDVLKVTVTVLTLIGAVLAGVYAYRKQRLSEGDATRADASHRADRYTTAAEQLGHDQAAVRLAGVYALARLADDWAEQRQVCIDVLCAYLRMPYEPDPTALGHKAGEREVRHTIIRVIRDHLRDPDASTSWSTYAFDFIGVAFDGGDFSRSHFLGTVSFVGAEFSGGIVSFVGAEFSGGTVSFGDATFSGGKSTSMTRRSAAARSPSTTRRSAEPSLSGALCQYRRAPRPNAVVFAVGVLCLAVRPGGGSDGCECV